MKIPKKKRRIFPKVVLVVLTATLLGAAGFAYYAYTQHQATQPPSAPVVSIPKPIKDEDKKPAFAPLSEVPARIAIKKIGVDATIEALGLTADGFMDAPKTNEGVGWYDKSAKAGEGKYSVLLDGHYGTAAQPAVFYRLAELKNGDTIKLTGEKGTVLTYEVVEKAQQPVGEVDMKKAFKRYPGAGQSLTLITCEGNYDASKSAYDKRTIIYAKRIA